MAKTAMCYFGLDMRAEGKAKFCKEQTEAFLRYVRGDNSEWECKKLDRLAAFLEPDVK